MKEEQTKDLMKRLLPEKILSLLREIGKVAQREKCSAYLVGGLVRDLFLGVKNLDIDISVEGEGIAFAEAIALSLKGRIQGRTRFGTAIVIFPGRIKVDVAMARKEAYRHPGALPEVRPSSLKEDQYRRDFTVNSLSIKLNPEEFGVLVDYFDSKKDLETKSLRALHDKSFLDDPTRIFRAVRFSERYGFAIEKHTQKLIQEAVKQSMLKEITIERLRDELVLIFNEEHPSRAIRKMAELNELKFIHPKIKFTKELDRLTEEIEGSLSWFRKTFPEEKVCVWMVYFSALLSELSSEEIRETCRIFKLSEKNIDKVLWGGKKSEKNLTQLNQRKKLSPSEIYKLLKNLSVESLILFLAKSDECAQERIMLFLKELRFAQTKVSGKDLKELGLEPGPEFSLLLEELLLAQLDGKLKTRTDELKYLKQKK